MNFIERWFHIFPDGGSGATEASVIALFILAIVAFSLRMPIRKAISRLTRQPARLK